MYPGFSRVLLDIPGYFPGITGYTRVSYRALLDMPGYLLGYCWMYPGMYRRITNIIRLWCPSTLDDT